MAEHSYNPSDAKFVAETELLRGASLLPSLSNRLRRRVLEAATSAYQQTRRWSQARQAASFLCVCLMASFVLSPLAGISLPNLEAAIDVTSLEPMGSPLQPNSAWSMRSNREILGLGRGSSTRSSVVHRYSSSSRLVTQIKSSLPDDTLLAEIQTSDGWGTVQAFQAVRSRSQSTLQRAFAAN